MAQTRKNNRHLKSMEEFKCKSNSLKLFFAALIVILLSLLFFSRGNTSKEVAKAETISIYLVNQVDTKQLITTESTHVPEAISMVEIEQQIEMEEFAQTAESSEASPDIESADYVEEPISLDSASETSSSEEQVYEDFVISLLEEYEYEDSIIPITDEEIVILTRVVLHEVGASQPYYPNANIDDIQQCMARVVVNQVIEGRWGNCVSDIVFYPGHFDGAADWAKEEIEDNSDESSEADQEDNSYVLSETEQEDITLALKNIMKVLQGDDSHSSTITIEMSFPNFSDGQTSDDCTDVVDGQTFDDCIDVMESQVGPVIPYFWTTTADNRLLVFAESDKERLAEMIAKANEED